MPHFAASYLGYSVCLCPIKRTPGFFSVSEGEECGTVPLKISPNGDRWKSVFVWLCAALPSGLSAVSGFEFNGFSPCPRYAHDSEIRSKVVCS